MKPDAGTRRIGEKRHNTKRGKEEHDLSSICIDELEHRRILSRAAELLRDQANDIEYRFADEEGNHCHLRQEIEAKASVITKLQHQLQQAKEKQRDPKVIQGFRDEQQCLKKEIETLKANNKQLSHEKMDLETMLRNNQDAAFDRLGETKWQPEPDNAVKDKLMHLDQRIQRWSKKNAIPSPHHLKDLSKADSEDLDQILRLVFDNDTPSLLDGLTESTVINQMPAMLLQALVSHNVYSKVIGKPFFFLSTLIGNDNTADENRFIPESEDDTEILSRIMDFIGKEPGNAWRAELLRLFDPGTSRANDSSFGRNVNEKSIELTRAINNEAERLCLHFMLDHGALIGKGLPEAERTELRSIFEFAGTFSYKLWTRKGTHKIYDIRRLKTPFSNRLLGYQAHHVHNRQLDETPEALNGKRPVLCLSPAVMARGKPDGTGLQKERLWKPAIVYMGAPPVLAGPGASAAAAAASRRRTAASVVPSNWTGPGQTSGNAQPTIKKEAQVEVIAMIPETVSETDETPKTRARKRKRAENGAVPEY